LSAPLWLTTPLLMMTLSRTEAGNRRSVVGPHGRTRQARTGALLFE